MFDCDQVFWLIRPHLLHLLLLLCLTSFKAKRKHVKWQSAFMSETRQMSHSVQPLPDPGKERRIWLHDCKWELWQQNNTRTTQPNYTVGCGIRLLFGRRLTLASEWISLSEWVKNIERKMKEKLCFQTQFNFLMCPNWLISSFELF